MTCVNRNINVTFRLEDGPEGTVVLGSYLSRRDCGCSCACEVRLMCCLSVNVMSVDCITKFATLTIAMERIEIGR